jgi:hypothetical protein
MNGAGNSGDTLLNSSPEFDALICPECGLEAGTVQSAGNVQRAILDAYRKREAVASELIKSSPPTK